MFEGFKKLFRDDPEEIKRIEQKEKEKKEYIENLQKNCKRHSFEFVKERYYRECQPDDRAVVGYCKFCGYKMRVD